MIRGVHESSDVDSDNPFSSAVLTIADLAGAERERKTGNAVCFSVNVSL